MATQAELQTKVNEKTVVATEARTAWKAAIPGPDAPKMTVEEQANVDALEAAYITAKDDRRAAEDQLASWSPPAPAPASDSSSATSKKRQEELEAEWLGGYF